ncbi:MAG: SDR family NAD(P)-dependent oxidoreductase [Oscillibacter sp.]|nr:SDR family NAD(P)-dependent oxidoreductase [Oscillibacter sp.]
MKTAIITGASSGLGRELVRQLADVFPEVEQYWLIARRADRLEELAASLPEGRTAECLALDLCDTMSFMTLQEKLAAEQPEVVLLINNAGCGYLGNIGEVDTSTQTRMIDLNLRALTALTNIVVPFMVPGSCVLNVSSIAAFCPNPRMTVYSASKAYVSAFTIGIAEELRAKGITATAVCPAPMRTEFLDVGNITGNSKMFATLPYCDQVQVAGGALRAARAGRTIYTPRLFYKFYRFLAKVTPVKLMVKFAKT